MALEQQRTHLGVRSSGAGEPAGDDWTSMPVSSEMADTISGATGMGGRTGGGIFRGSTLATRQQVQERAFGVSF